MQFTGQSNWVHSTSVGAGETAAAAVVRAVAAVDGRDPAELPALYRVVDGDALNALFEHSGSPPDLEVQFDYGGYRVRVTPSTVRLRERTPQ